MVKAKLFLLLCMTFLCSNIQAQSENPDFVRSIGKIYVVVAVILAIFIGIVAFLIYLERKLSRLENQINNK